MGRLFPASPLDPLVCPLVARSFGASHDPGGIRSLSASLRSAGCSSPLDPLVCPLVARSFGASHDPGGIRSLSASLRSAGCSSPLDPPPTVSGGFPVNRLGDEIRSPTPRQVPVPPGTDGAIVTSSRAPATAGSPPGTFLRTRAWQLYLAAGGMAAVLYLTVPTLNEKGPFFNLIGISSV